MSDESPRTKRYETHGGPVRIGDSIYVDRRPDTLLQNRLAKDFVTFAIHGPRQTGKTSLAHALRSRMQRCTNHLFAGTDFQSVTHKAESGVDWFASLFRVLARDIGIPKRDVGEWCSANTPESLSDWLLQFVGRFLRRRFRRPLVLVFDEIDSVLLQGGHASEFFEGIRLIHAKRAELRLSTILVGLNTPERLLPVGSPVSFNVGKTIRLPDFEVNGQTVSRWAAGLALPKRQALDVAGRVLTFTGGHPYLSSMVLGACVEEGIDSRDSVDVLTARMTKEVRQDRGPLARHFESVRRTVLDHADEAYPALTLYRSLLSAPVTASEADDALRVLRLAGLVRERRGLLSPRNPFYQQVFDDDWITATRTQISSPRRRGAAPRTRVRLRRLESRPRICVINTGGTIGMELLDNDQLGQPRDLRQFFDNYPEIHEIAEVEPSPHTCEDGANIYPPHWTEVAETIYRKSVTGDFAGFVVACGTDTMEFFSAAVAFALGPQLQFPVVFTGSQAPHYVLHGDARVNLLRACVVAGMPIPEVVICFNEYVLRAVRAQKKDDRGFEGFHSPVARPLAIIAEKIEPQPYLLRKPRRGQLPRPAADFCEDILHIPQVPGIRPDVYQAILDRGTVKGITIESQGLGNLPTKGKYSFSPLIRNATHAGIPVVITARFPTQPEFVGMYKPASLPLDAGAIWAGNMTSSAARVKLMWALGQILKSSGQERKLSAKAIDRVKRTFKKNFVGEYDEEAAYSARESSSE